MSRLKRSLILANIHLTSTSKMVYFWLKVPFKDILDESQGIKAGMKPHSQNDQGQDNNCQGNNQR
jgi:hypothetical protein